VGKYKMMIIIRKGERVKIDELKIPESISIFCGSGYLETVENLGLYRQPEENQEDEIKEKPIIKYDNHILTPLIPIIEIEPDRVKRC
jgi:hypothetical protein